MLPVFDDAETDGIARRLLAGMKYRNAGQVCSSPTRLFVQEKSYDKFVAKFTDLARGICSRRRVSILTSKMGTARQSTASHMR